MADNNENDDGYRYVKAYGKEDYARDEKLFNEFERTGKIDWSSFKRLMINDICLNSKILETKDIGGFRLEDIDFALRHPNNGYKILMEASSYLMRISPHYFRLNSLYSNMALFCWWIDLYDVRDSAKVETIKKQYSALAAKLENMNLKHEFSKIMKVLPYQDIYYGLIVENSTDFFFQKLDYRICKLYQVQDGLYNFKMDLSSINQKELNAYPDYVKQAYLDYLEGKLSSNWYVPPADKQICIKLNSQWTYPYPLLIGLIKDILDLDTYKKLKLQSARTDNYKAIMVKVPIDETTVDKPLLTPETLGLFAEINRESMSDDIGLIHTLGSDGEAVSFKDSSNTRNNVSDAIDEIYNSSGASKELFNGSASATAITMSVENDSGFVYDVYRQFERWINRYIKLRKYNKSTFKFYFYLLDITIFNRDNVTKRYKEAVTLGVSCIDKWLASMDMTPSRTLGSFILHNDIFDFHTNFVPLATSYTEPAQVTEEEVGRPKNSDKGEILSDEGEKTADNDKNNM
nr:MAG TPA: Portal protein [Caudoviricetes sp.]